MIEFILLGKYLLLFVHVKKKQKFVDCESIKCCQDKLYF